MGEVMGIFFAFYQMWREYMAPDEIVYFPNINEYIIFILSIYTVRICNSDICNNVINYLQIVLITGAGRGIGECLAKLFSECGATVVLWDINDVRPTLLFILFSDLAFSLGWYITTTHLQMYKHLPHSCMPLRLCSTCLKGVLHNPGAYTNVYPCWIIITHTALTTYKFNKGQVTYIIISSLLASDLTV